MSQKGRGVGIEEAVLRAPSPAPATRGFRGRATARILVVHPDPPTRQLVSEVLTELPAAVEACEDGLAALRLLERRSFDLVVTGDWLPGMRGIAIAETCLAGGDPTPVVILEAEGPFGVVEPGGRRRPARLSCPFSPAALLDVCELRIRSAALSS